MSEKSYFGGWWLWVTLLIAVSVVGFTGLRYVGLIGKTAVERIVFEQSYQRQAGDDAKLAIFEAQAAALRVQLNRSDLTQAQRADYQAQLSAVTIQIATTGN